MKISDKEFKSRIEKLQKKMQDEKFDLILAYGNEAEPQYVRYLCDYWPSFETAGVLVAREGEPILLIGPESYCIMYSPFPTRSMVSMTYSVRLSLCPQI